MDPLNWSFSVAISRSLTLVFTVYRGLKYFDPCPGDRNMLMLTNKKATPHLAGKLLIGKEDGPRRLKDRGMLPVEFESVKTHSTNQIRPQGTD